MELTLTVSNVDQARQAIDILQGYLRLQEPPAPAPSEAPIATLGLGTRARNCLLANDIKTVEQLLYWSHNELRRMPNLGRHTLDEITEALASRGLTLGMKYRRTFTHP